MIRQSPPSYLKAVYFVLMTRATNAFGPVTVSGGLTWCALRVNDRFVWNVFQDRGCIVDSRQFEPGGYPTLVEAVSACGRYMERNYPDVVFFE